MNLYRVTAVVDGFRYYRNMSRFEAFFMRLVLRGRYVVERVNVRVRLMPNGRD